MRPRARECGDVFRVDTDRKRALKGLAAAALVACLFVFAGVALSAGSYSDAVGDANMAPDVATVTVAEQVAGSLQITVAVGNFDSASREQLDQSLVRPRLGP